MMAGSEKLKIVLYSILKLNRKGMKHTTMFLKVFIQ